MLLAKLVTFSRFSDIDLQENRKAVTMTELDNLKECT